MSLEEMLAKVPNDDKCKVFDELVREFQGQGKLIHMRRRTRELANGVLVSEDYPVYQFVLRVDGHDDFAAAILKLLKRPNVK